MQPVNDLTDQARKDEAPALALEALCRGLNDDLAKLGAIEEERSLRERGWRDERAVAKDESAKALAALEAEEPPPAEEDPDAIFAAITKRRDRMLKGVADAATSYRRLVRQQLERDIATAEGAMPPPTKDLSPQAKAELARRSQAFVGEMGEHVAAVSALLERYHATCRRVGVRDRDAALENATASTLPNWELPRLMKLVSQETEQSAAALEAVEGRSLYGWCTTTAFIGRQLILLVVPAMALASVIWLWPIPEAKIWCIGVGVGLQALGFLLTIVLRLFLRRPLLNIGRGLLRLQSKVASVQESGVREFETGAPLKQRLEQYDKDELPRRIQGLKQGAEKAVAVLRERERRVTERVKGHYAPDLAAMRGESEARARSLADDLAGRRSTLEQSGERRRADADRRWEETRAALGRRWQDLAGSIARWSADAGAAMRRRHAAWSDPGWERWTPASGYAPDLPLGTASQPMSASFAGKGAEAFPCPAGELALPVCLAFPARTALLVRTGPTCRQQALDLVNQLMLRALAAFQPGRMLLTLIDPVGLGDSFASVLAVADHDERLLGPGVLSEPSRIERGLADHVSHLEVVIQKHLRGRYDNIDEYNREAGELQEPLRLVVCADFPAGFTEHAFEHLSTLVRSGARCGVHVVIVHDDRKPLPPALDLAAIRSSGMVLREVRGSLVVDREGMHAWAFTPEPLPTRALAAALVHKIGEGAQKAKRIEVPFSSIAPPADQVWSLSSAQMLRIPIGKRGADRLQHFELGKGTCQHALVGGRTGSGKSTLFHVLITSGALWYHPRELQFHLIDFKKGVEFKPFANHHLPHAAVIAIESDREFGLNVLRNLDAELTRRGEMFRKAGAHDLAGHRATGGEHLPRVLLLIDEFQEFFTDDDVIARDAALLLDRFVRQGRAFGVHVLLGSQTLGGAYALAKSSIGQMGVRIALPCNESDGHLLLHEDNDATRLLTHPGDGIYNDRAGTIEGNSPFQVCWLTEEQEATRLAAIATRRESDEWQPARKPVVFEGNGPARLEEDAALAELCARPFRPADAELRAGVGQASSLSGAAEIRFPTSAGGNLLVLGQNRAAAAASCGAILLGILARHQPSGIRCLIVDGEDASGPFAAYIARLQATLPHAPTRLEGREAAAAVIEVATILERRASGEDPARTPVFLVAFALQRLRQLRADEDAGFGASAAGEPPSERFLKIIASGAEYGVHVIAWSDSLASIQRALPRRALKDFDRRILFQMSASDSMEIIDDEAASRLGLHTALSVSLMDGSLEKFRPFALPEPGFIEGLGAQLASRFAAR